MISLAQVSVYDIESKTWYPVTASGDIPGDRVGFCAVVSASPNHSTYQVTIFGGWHLGLGHGARFGYDDIYVLNVPSFRWIKINGKNDFETSNFGNTGRANHRCVIYNDAQMIVLGGSVVAKGEAQVDTSCRQEYPPIRVLDTNTYTWKKTFDPSIKYSVPDTVTQVVGGE